MHITRATHTLDDDVDVIARRLIENLQLRWGYSLFHVDDYMDEQDRQIYVIFGSAATVNGNDATLRGLIMVRLTSESSVSTRCEIQHSRGEYRGYPFNNAKYPHNIEYTEDRYSKHNITRDILVFCTEAHSESTSLLGWLQRTVRRYLKRTDAHEKDKRT